MSRLTQQHEAKDQATCEKKSTVQYKQYAGVAGNHLSKGQQRNIVMTTDSNDPRTCVREKIASQQKPEDEKRSLNLKKGFFVSTSFKFVILIV